MNWKISELNTDVEISITSLGLLQDVWGLLYTNQIFKKSQCVR